MKPEHIVAAARRHIGTPWRHQGRLPGAALDCAGLVIVVARELGLINAEWDVADYGRQPDGTLLRLCDSMMQRQPDLQTGRVILLSIARDPQHMGIVGDYRHGGFSIIHAASAAGRVVETRLMFARNFVLRRVYSLPGAD